MNLISQINNILKRFETGDKFKSYKELHFDCLVVNDASTAKQPNLVKPDFIKSLEIFYNAHLMQKLRIIA